MGAESVVAWVTLAIGGLACWLYTKTITAEHKQDTKRWRAVIAKMAEAERELRESYRRDMERHRALMANMAEAERGLRESYRQAMERHRALICTCMESLKRCEQEFKIMVGHIQDRATDASFRSTRMQYRLARAIEDIDRTKKQGGAGVGEVHTGSHWDRVIMDDICSQENAGKAEGGSGAGTVKT